MKERPILFSVPMVNAILAGRKTQTRRVVKLPKSGDFDGVRVADGALLWSRPDQPTGTNVIKSPYGAPGDRLWVRETWRPARTILPVGWSIGYAANEDRKRVAPADVPDDWQEPLAAKTGFVPSIHMPRWASRITLEVTDVRVERLWEISVDDAKAEGVELVRGRDVPAAMGGGVETWRDYLDPEGWVTSAQSSFSSLWRSINGAESWAANPWVWVVNLKRVAP